jgi:aryl-alcohol dehydrogenase-like predicted oxidoreductase
MGTDRIAHLHSCPIDRAATCSLDAAVRVQGASRRVLRGWQALAWAIASVSASSSARWYFAEALREYRVALEQVEDRDLVLQAMAEVHLLRKDPKAALDPFDYALRFVLAQPVSSVLVGTTRLDHLTAAAIAASREPLDDRDARARFDPSWPGVI